VSPESPTDSLPKTGQPGTTFCFRAKQERPGWSLLNLVPAKTTVDLAALVCGAPEFLSMDGGEPVCQAAVVLSERGDATVVVAVDELGGIRLVGCPSQPNRLALTTVVQELLVFNGRLWRMPPDEFAAVVEKRMGGNLGDYFSSRAAIGWSENGFRSGLGRSLERGRFPVVLLLSGSNPEVAEAVAHLRSHNIEVRSLGVELYESSGVEVIMPRVLEVGGPEAPEEREPAKLTSRSAAPLLRTPPRPTSSRAAVAATETVESTPPRKIPRADEPPAVAAEPPPVETPLDTTVSVAEPPAEATPVENSPWTSESAEPVSAAVPPPAKSKPFSSAPPPPSEVAGATCPADLGRHDARSDGRQAAAAAAG